MKKQILLLVLMLLPIVANAYDVEVDGIYYNLITKSMRAEVTKGEKRYSGEIKIPETINVNESIYTVAIIGEDAFSYNGSVTDLWIPQTITSINSSAFRRCEGLQTVHITNLEAWCKITFGSTPLSYACHLFLNDNEIVDITIPQSITTIGNSTFENLVNLRTVVFHDNIEKIRESAFAGCKNLESIQFPKGLTEIWNYAFAGCSSLRFSELPPNIAKISQCAFRDCESLTSLNIPASLTDLNYAAFINCGNIKSISVSKDNPVYDSRNNCNAIIITKSNTLIRGGCTTEIPDDVKIIGQYAFSGCTEISNFKIPNSVKNIGALAFDGCDNLQSITIGKGVTNIEESAFSNCGSLMDFYCYTNEIPKTGIDVFKNSYIAYATLHVRESLIDLYYLTSPWSSFKEIVKLDIPQYVLMYMVDGDEYKSFKIEEDEIITPEPAPTKEGYTFSGWSEIPKIMPAKDITVTGTFTVNKYKLTYIVDGEEYKTYELDYGAGITPETAPTKEGYTFSGWSEIPATMPAHDVTVIGTFTMNILGKCATPLIRYVNGELKMECETEGVDFVTDITNSDIKKHYESTISLNATYYISVYATKSGYENSDVATATLCWIDVEPKTEGITNITANIRALPLLIQTNGSTLSVSGADDGTPITVYSINGTEAGSAISQNGAATIPTTLQSGSAAIVKVGNKSIKVVMK